jgi:hypothetical protein
MRTHRLLPLLLLLPPLLSGCGAVLGVGAGVVISQDLMDNNTYVAQISEDIDVAWAKVKVSLGKQSDVPMQIDDDRRAAIAEIDDARVTVSVEAYDAGRCRLLVSARKYGVTNGEIADLVFGRLLENFEQS